MGIAKKLSNLISEKDITQKQLANELKVSPSTINGYLTKGREPDIEMLLKLSRYFDVTTDYLLGFNSEYVLVAEGALSKKENELITQYRRLDSNQQDFLIDQIKFLIYQNYKRK